MPAAQPPAAPVTTKAAAAPSTPPAASPPAAPAEHAPGDFMAAEMQDFADMDAGKPATPAKPAAPTTPEKPAELEKPAEPAEAAKPPETPAEPVRTMKAADLRTAYEGLKKRVKDEFEPQLQSLKAKVQEYEGKGNVDTKAIAEELQSVRQRNAELEKHIAFVDYAQSKEFQKEHALPYREAWDEAVAEFRQLTVRIKTGEDEFGEPTFENRTATEEDILTLANMNLSDMDEAANKMFGASATRAINHIQNLKRLTAKQQKALDDAKENATKFRQSRQGELQARMQQRSKQWEEINKSLESKYPRAFNPVEGDAEDATSHVRGFAMANLMFAGPKGLTQEQIEALPANFRDTIKAGQPLSESQVVQLHAISRLKMANHDRKVEALKKATARISELEKALSAYEKSEPDASKAGESGGASGLTPEQVIENEIRAMDK